MGVWHFLVNTFTNIWFSLHCTVFKTQLQSFPSSFLFTRPNCTEHHKVPPGDVSVHSGRASAISLADALLWRGQDVPKQGARSLPKWAKSSVYMPNTSPVPASHSQRQVLSRTFIYMLLHLVLTLSSLTLSLLFARTSFPLHSQIARLRSEFIRVSQPPGADPIQFSHWYEEKEKARELTDLANEHSKHNRGGCQTYYKPSSFPCVKWIMGNYREALWNSAYEDSLYRERIAELTKAICWYHIFSILCAL